MMFEPRFRLLLASAICLSVGWSNAALALKADRQQPMELSADGWIGKLDGEKTFKGNLRINQGTLKIQADTGTVKYDAGEPSRAVLEGNPAQVSQARDGGGTVTAQARRIDYDLRANKVVLTGGVKIEENGNVTTGERFEYSLESGAIVGDGGGGQINMRLVPKPKTP